MDQMKRNNRVSNGKTNANTPEYQNLNPLVFACVEHTLWDFDDPKQNGSTENK